MFVVITYDIPHDKRRTKLSKLLLDYGGTRVQRSVFECFLAEQAWKKLQAAMETLLEATEDSIRCYILCENCQARIVHWGLAEVTDAPSLRII